MGKHMGLNGKSKSAKRLERHSLDIGAMLDNGIILKGEIAKKLKISIYDIGHTLTAYPELRAKWREKRRSIADIAADNVATIVSDTKHPKNYEASKFILQTFKSDLDADLDAKDSDDLSVDITGEKDSSKKISISFTKRNKAD